MTPNTTHCDTWTGCYSASWRDLIVPAAFGHPAKMSRSLLDRILDHVAQEGWLAPGGIILDPFGGIGSTGILGAYKGYSVVCVELEERFCKLARANFAMHSYKLGVFNCPQPVILQGDSRRLCELLAGADCIVSWPPFQGAHSGAIDEKSMRGSSSWINKVIDAGGYGTSPGQLGAMKPGSVDAVVASPPHGPEALGHKGQPSEIDKEKRLYGRINNAQYGQTPGNLGNLKPGDVDLICSSPPWEKTNHPKGESKEYHEKFVAEHNKKWPKRIGKKNQWQNLTAFEMPSSDKQLANSSGDTFWGAAKIIVQQCHQILKPGGVAVWVTKRFVRAGKIVEFSQDWARLCESVGFEVVCWHKAMLVKETVDDGLFGHKIVKKTERKSFFRRLAEAKNSPRIDWEDVICMRSRRAAPR